MMDFDEEDQYEYEIERAGKRYRRLGSSSNNNKNNKLREPVFERMSSEERLHNYMKFYLHYGACSLVWFINLPVIIFVTSFVSELYRPRLVLSKLFKKHLPFLITIRDNNE